MSGCERAAIHKAFRIQKLGAQGQGGGVVGIVILFQNHFDQKARIGVATLRNPLLGELHGRIAKSIERLRAHISGGRTTLRQDIHCALEIGVG